MTDTHETIADIIAEARDKYTVHECNQCEWRKCCSKGFGSEECGKFRESIFLKLGIEDGYFTQLLDRLEAAHKREVRETEDLFRKSLKKQEDALRDQYELLVGFSNIAKLREALRLCMGAMCKYCRADAEARGLPTECVNGCEALLKAKAALASSPRNCDKVKTSWDVLKKWHEGLDTANDIVRMLDWLLAPATEQEGGNDGNE